MTVTPNGAGRAELAAAKGRRCAEPSASAAGAAAAPQNAAHPLPEALQQEARPDLPGQGRPRRLCLQVTGTGSRSSHAPNFCSEFLAPSVARRTRGLADPSLPHRQRSATCPASPQPRGIRPPSSAGAPGPPRPGPSGGRGAGAPRDRHVGAAAVPPLGCLPTGAAAPSAGPCLAPGPQLPPLPRRVRGPAPPGPLRGCCGPGKGDRRAGPQGAAPGTGRKREVLAKRGVGLVAKFVML